MGAKVSKVTLSTKDGRVTKAFEIDHADRILRMKDNGGWKVAEGESLEWSKENGFRHKKNKEGDRISKQEGADKPCD